MKLGTCALISSGIITQRVQAETAGKAVAFYPLLSLKHFSIDGIRREDLEVIACARNLSRDELTMEGEIILRSAPPFGAVHIGPESTGIIIPHYFYRIIPKAASGRFLAAWLNTTRTLELLQKKSEGSSLITIKRRQLLEIEIPDFTPDEQAVYTEIDRLARREQKLCRELADRRFRLAQEALAHMTESAEKGE